MPGVGVRGAAASAGPGSGGAVRGGAAEPGGSGRAGAGAGGVHLKAAAEPMRRKGPSMWGGCLHQPGPGSFNPAGGEARRGAQRGSPDAVSSGAAVPGIPFPVSLPSWRGWRGGNKKQEEKKPRNDDDKEKPRARERRFPPGRAGPRLPGPRLLPAPPGGAPARGRRVREPAAAGTRISKQAAAGEEGGERRGGSRAGGKRRAAPGPCSRWARVGGCAAGFASLRLAAPRPAVPRVSAVPRCAHPLPESCPLPAPSGACPLTPHPRRPPGVRVPPVSVRTPGPVHAHTHASPPAPSRACPAQPGPAPAACPPLRVHAPPPRYVCVCPPAPRACPPPRAHVPCPVPPSAAGPGTRLPPPPPPPSPSPALPCSPHARTTAGAARKCTRVPAHATRAPRPACPLVLRGGFKSRSAGTAPRKRRTPALSFLAALAAGRHRPAGAWGSRSACARNRGFRRFLGVFQKRFPSDRGEGWAALPGAAPR